MKHVQIGCTGFCHFAYDRKVNTVAWFPSLATGKKLYITKKFNSASLSLVYIKTNESAERNREMESIDRETWTY